MTGTSRRDSSEVGRREVDDYEGKSVWMRGETCFP